MASRRKIIGLVSISILAVLLVVAVAWWSFARNSGIAMTNALQPLGIALKKAGSDIVVAKQASIPSVHAAPPAGYLVAYEHDPEGFKADAKLFDTWISAMKLAASVLEHGPSGDWVKNSSTLDLVKPEFKVDPWGHSLCLMRRGDAVLVISGGPDAPDSPACKDVGMTVDDLREFPAGKLLQSRSGSLVLVAVRNARRSQHETN